MREAWIVVDLGFGDQGKGSLTDFLVRERAAHTVIRYNGGPQAAHTVVADDGRQHTFAQFGAGTLVPGVRTFLASPMAVQPWAMQVEAEHLARIGVSDAFERTQIAADAVVVTPFHRAANRLREAARGDARHGSCGVGVGEAVSDARSGHPTLRAADLVRPDLPALLRVIQRHKAAELAAIASSVDAAPDPDLADARLELRDPRAPELAAALLAPFRARAAIVSPSALGEVLAAPGAVVFEGAHGVLLDEDHGFHPHTTWSSCTTRNALQLLATHGYRDRVVRLGALRAYATRHGPGPFVTEDARLDLPEPHNPTGRWQGDFRVGWPDAVALRYALAATGGVDGLAVTCLDRLPSGPGRIAHAYAIGGAEVADLPVGLALEAQAELTLRLARASPVYTTLEPGPEALLVALSEAAATPVALTSSGPTAAGKRWPIEPAYDSQPSIAKPALAARV